MGNFPMTDCRGDYDHMDGMLKIDKKGRFVLPISLRNGAGIKPGDFMEIYIEGETIVMKKITEMWGMKA